MKITLNGEERMFAGPMSVAGLTVELGLDPRKLAVECNRAIVPRSAYETTVLSDGDRIEIVHFVGGG